MSNRYLIKKNKAKKGISPVIATVILVAVAVVIAAALAGFSSSLFGTYSSAGAAVTVKSINVDSLGDGSVILVNSGNVADALTSVSVVGFDAVTPAPSNVTLSIPPNNAGDMEATFELNGSTPGTFEQGQVVTVRLNLQSGSQLTQSVIVTP